MGKIKMGPQPLLFPLPTILVGAEVDGKANFMTVSWCGMAAFKPPALTIGIMPQRHTCKGIRKNRTFSVNIPGTRLAKQTDFCGMYSGKDKDKSQIFNVFYGELKTAPLIGECPVNLECKVVHEYDAGSHLLFIGEIVEVFLNEEAVTNGVPDAGKIDPITFSIDNQKYRKLGPVFADAFKVGKEL